MIYELFVKPNSKKGPLVVKTGKDLTVYLREKPIDGKANQALIKVLAEHFQIKKSQIKLKTGQRSKHKLVEIDKDEGM